MRAAMSPGELRALAESSAVVAPEVAFKACGVGRTKGWELIRAGEWPTRVLRFGRLVRIPTRDLLDFLGIDDKPPENSETGPQQEPGPPENGDRQNVRQDLGGLSNEDTQPNR